MAQKKRARNKTAPTGASVEQFLNAVENPVRQRDCRAVMEFMAAETGEAPKMWGPSIIGFGSYRYAYQSGREGEMPLTGVSPAQTVPRAVHHARLRRKRRTAGTARQA